MATIETNGNGTLANPGGVYRHPDTGEELVFTATGKFGNPGADAAVRLGFVYVGPANSKKVDVPADPTAGPIADTDPTRASVADLESQLADAKAREESVSKAQKADSSSLAEQPAKAEAATPAPAKSEKGAK